jgi:tRNA (guanine37-N1)-methyltransferase
VEIDVLTLFPEWFDWMRRPRHLANAALSAELALRCYSFRDHTPLHAGQVDDAPYGGGPGMVLRVDVVAATLEGVYGEPAERVREGRRVVVLTPRGRPFTDAVARELAALPALTLLCGRYEGFDERVHSHLANDEISLGPFVLAGGEVAAMALVDAVGRRLPGALGNAESLDSESFSPALGGGTEHPHYTRPASFRGWEVPPVLLSGDHGAVERWRAERVGRAGADAMLPVVSPGAGTAQPRQQERSP